MEDHSGHRQRLIDRFDKETLCEHEYLEMLLFNAVPRMNTNGLAHRLLARFGSIRAIFHAPIKTLCSVEGVGKNVASFLACVGKFYEAYNRGETSGEFYPVRYDKEGFLVFIKREYARLPYEKLDLFFLDGEANVIGRSCYSLEDKHHVTLEPEQLLEMLATESPSGLIIAHNHPRGKCAPSPRDDDTTKMFQDFCRLHNVLLCDHFIYAADGVYSYYESGKLERFAQESRIKNGATEQKGMGNT